ncbi:hypothetical protein ID866_1777 [Astraeus odoratus]|nr:hypothetical protein ID866_1777 [Astraeus odoratus]
MPCASATAPLVTKAPERGVGQVDVMTVVDNPGDSDIVRLLNTIQELSDQLSRNRTHAISLHSTASAVKTQATHSQTGFVLRRFNLDKSKEEYDAELERMNCSLSLENFTLQHDNKQLGVVIREYEQTLESVMSAFRTRARDVQEHELALIREYESKLLARESENLHRALISSTTESASLGRISSALRTLMRVINGEEGPTREVSSSPLSRSSMMGVEEEEFNGETKEDKALEQEIELARLEQENAILRRMLGLDLRESEYSGGAIGTTSTAEQQRPPVPRPLSGVQQKKLLGGAPGTVGPYGTYKRRS